MRAGRELFPPHAHLHSKQNVQFLQQKPSTIRKEDPARTHFIRMFLRTQSQLEPFRRLR